ncbi:Ca(2+)-dependent cysteine protease [Borealophlyctis nickersoniae]|nr:Ca(2+)-dependent cysteine protease [Borealophlyctis nickersoniae]
MIDNDLAQRGMIKVLNRTLRIGIKEADVRVLDTPFPKESVQGSYQRLGAQSFTAEKMRSHRLISRVVHGMEERVQRHLPIECIKFKKETKVAWVTFGSPTDAHHVWNQCKTTRLMALSLKDLGTVILQSIGIKYKKVDWARMAERGNPHSALLLSLDTLTRYKHLWSALRDQAHLPITEKPQAGMVIVAPHNWWKFAPNECLIMTDDQQDLNRIPTKANIFGRFRGAQRGDAFFLHYSGHGSQEKDTHGEEAEGLDESIVPLDYETNGQIHDDVRPRFLTLVLSRPTY